MFFYSVNSLFAFSFMINLQGAHNFLKMQNGTVRSIFDVFGVCHLAIQREIICQLVRVKTLNSVMGRIYI